MISRSRVAPSEFPDHNINAVNNQTNARHSVTFCGVNGASSTSFQRSNGSTRQSFTGASAVATQDEDFSACIEWFRQNLANVAKHGKVTLKDFKHAARVLDGFAENLFKLFDSDCSGAVSLQELVGGLGRLTVHSRKNKILHWFEQIFASVSGEDQLLQLDELKQALGIHGFLERFYQLMDVDNTGKLTLPELLDAFNKLTCLDRDAKWLAWFEQQFSMVAGEDRQIDINEFKQALHVKKSFFAERFFKLFDKDNSGTISLKELMDGLSLLTNGSETDKLNFLFQVYDVDGNGYIDFDELRLVLKSCMDESALKFSEDKLDELTRALFEDADTDNSGTISFEELQAELDKHPGVVENLTISAANWLKPPVSKKKAVSDVIPTQLKWKYIRNNMQSVIYIVLFILINIGLFIVGVVLYYDKGPLVAIARGCGQCLNFNPVLVIILMFRRCLTWIRSTRFANWLPLDQHIELHKLTGYTITFFSFVHFGAHLINLTLLSREPDGKPLWEYFFYYNTGFGWVAGTAGVTGVVLLIILVIMVLCSLPCVRRNGYFEVFYLTHLLFVPWYIFLILHATHFWKWFLVPGSIYILERIMRSKWVKLAKYGRTYISEGTLLPSKVTHLVITRPSNFTYQPGDYVFIQIPCIARYEWHPFTISSAPEQDGFIWLHVRSVGTWTNKLYDFFESRNEENERRMIAMQLPRDQQVQQTHELQQAVQALEEDGEFYHNYSIADAHPLAPQANGHCQRGTMVHSHSNASMASMTHGQNFSHMYKPPNVIHVRVDPEDDKGIEVYLDGPYGTSSTHIFQAEHAVLIGAGIGVTPYASILQSIVMRYRSIRQVCPKCNHRWTGDLASSIMTLKKVDFFWINRDQKSFEWFVSLLSELEIEQSEQSGFDRFLEMHMYMTSALSKTDMKAIGLQMALDLIHKKEKRDLITGLKTRTQAGRPNWNEVFQTLENERKGKVTIFFCGSPAISKILKAKCSEYNFEFRREYF